MRIEASNVYRQNSPERTFGVVKTYYLSLLQDLPKLERVRVTQDPSQIELVTTSLRGNLEKLREEMIRIVTPRSYPSAVFLGPPHRDGRRTAYYPAENKVYLVPSQKSGRFDDRGKEIPFDEWTKNDGIVFRVARVLIQPIPAPFRRHYQQDADGLPLS